MLSSPYRQDRDRARGRFNSGEFVEVHVSTSLQTCEQRDPKDLYKKVCDGGYRAVVVMESRVPKFDCAVPVATLSGTNRLMRCIQVWSV